MMFLSLLLASQLSWSSGVKKEKVFTYDSFSKAEEAKSFVRCDMQSTLIGFLTARFSGYAKNFSLSWKNDANKKTVGDLKIIVPVSFMDTNREGRTKEMQEDSLEIQKYPEIKVNINDELKLEETQLNVPGIFYIRGKEIKKNFPLNLESIESQWKVSGEFTVRLSEMNIISPTIAKGIASFEDEVYVRYQFYINKDY